MSWKFRRRVQLFPGVRLNLSRSGVSTTIGPRGLNVNFNRQGTYLNKGIPGTGIYDRQRIGGRSGRKTARRGSGPSYMDQAYAAPPQSTEAIMESTCEGLSDLKDTLLACHEEREALFRDMLKVQRRLIWMKRLHLVSRLLIIGFFVKHFQKWKEQAESNLNLVKDCYSDCKVNIDLQCDGRISQAYKGLLEAYAELRTCSRIWDVSQRYAVDALRERTRARESVARSPVRFEVAELPHIDSSLDGMHFQNATGADLYFYPAFTAVIDHFKRFALLETSKLEMQFSSIRFMEPEVVPDDAKVVDQSWLRSNKDGSRDRRFKDNYQLPVCAYGEISISSAAGLQEVFCFSNPAKAEAFAEAFKAFQSELRPA